MQIYHGADYKKLGLILSVGLKPRGKRKSVWSNAPSHPSLIYLSTCYPFYFSRCAQTKKSFTKGLVFEIDMDKLNKELLYPDEDFIWHVLKEKNPELKIEQVRKDLWHHRKNWQLSLDNLGNVAYLGDIKPEYITRYCIVDFGIQKELGMSVLDPIISLSNYLVMGKYYKDLVAWFFDDIKKLPQVDDAERWLNSGSPEAKSEDNQKRYDFWVKASENREGITVVDLKKA